MGKRGHRGGHGVLLAAVALFLVTAVACSSGNADEDGEPRASQSTTTTASTSLTTTTTAEPPSREEAVVAGYRAHWAAWYAAAQAADPDVPAIAATTTGSFLEKTRAEIAAMRSSGERVRGDPGVPPIDSRQVRVAQFQSETTAVVVDCYVDNTVRYDAGGKPIGSTEPTFFSATATLVLADGTWKVASLQLKKDGCRA